MISNSGYTQSIKSHKEKSKNKSTSKTNSDNILLDTTKQNSVPFLDTLQNKTNGNKITSKLYNSVVKDNNNTKTAEQSESNFKKYKNKIIRNIEFKQLDVFGPTVTDTNLQAKSWLGKAGNKIHIQTSKNVLEKNLLIKPKTKIDPYLLADNERLLRNLPYIEDVKILVRPVKNSDSVDILIVTKDNWPIAFGMEINEVNSGMVGTWNKNIFGFGRELQNNIFWDSDKSPLLGYEGVYRLNNMYGVFINGLLRYKNSHGTISYFTDFQRDFFTPNIKYAGGLRFENLKTIQNIETRDSVYSNVNIHSYKADMWIGRAFYLKKCDEESGTRKSIMTALRYSDYFFYERPDVTENSFYDYYNLNILLGSVALSQQGFSKGKLIYGYGVTEDIPYGFLFQLTGGTEVDEFYNRKYFGIECSNGFIFSKQEAYLYNKIRFAGFLKDKNIQQGLFSFSSLYFTKLFKSNLYRFRYFFNVKYVCGINRFEDEYLTIEDKAGITGLKSDLLKGNRKLNFNFEAVSFTPFYLYGFRFVLFAYTDIGFIGPESDPVFCNELYTGIGAGIRLKNERLVFNTLEIKFSIYPYAPEDAKFSYIQISGNQKFQFNDFYIASPHLFEYR